ncbi:hypothetical protein CASFOL_023571 [Castilleja foliolosa]|uniref:Protein kinase domain-containing protein n=1 Tax=Castilleja foliolosa TaxID=1961234 RepID=A0ABD3CPT6_9LAMI
MAELELDAVLQFLRKNGLSECESALMEDIMEKTESEQMGSSSSFQKFIFPPPLRIPATQRPPLPPQHGGGGSSNGSSEDEFVSLGSSDSTSPYRIHTTLPVSRASSDKSSQFGTARDYLDFDMQNDPFVPSVFDFDGDDPSEDKFIMSEQTGEPVEDQQNYFEHETYKDNDFDNCNLDDSKLIENDNFDLTVDGLIISEKSCEPEFALDEEGGELRADIDIEDDYEIFDLRIIHRKNRTGFEENKELPIVLNSLIAGRYYIMEFLGSAAFSRVVRAHDLCSGMDVCLKIIKNNKDFFDQSLDEIKLLKFVNKYDPADEHHILRLYDYFYHQEHLFIVTELLRANLYEFQKYNRESGAEPYFTLHRLQVITRQCLEALSYLHDLGIVHCDLKPENILIKSYQTCEIKVIDLGSSCFQTDDLSVYIQSRSYRAPEVMLGLPYDQKIDVWSVGCILAELYSGEVLFPNEPIGILLAMIIGMLGSIDIDMLHDGQETHKYFTKDYDHLYYINEDTNEVEYIIPNEYSSLAQHLQISDSLFLNFLSYLLEMNPKRRPNAREALEHPWLSHLYDI